MSLQPAFVAKITTPPELTPVRPSDPALATILLLNAARRGFARLAALASADAEPDWAGFLAALVNAGSICVDTLVCPRAHPAVPVLSAAISTLDRAIVSYEYERAFAAELQAHEMAYLGHLDMAGVPGMARETLVAQIRREALLRDLEMLVRHG
ncbi:hypothetical protein ACSSV8_003725 [Roseovarius sp. MBR-79]